tara:strand:+ start:188 stop:490 length:303 start_codon:yes stop_codon:yes gene_type:complete
MENLVFGINIISAILLVILVLMQKSEGGALGIGVSQDSFVSTRSVSSFLTKTTALIASLFILTSIVLTVMSQSELPTTSVLEQTETETNTSSEPEVPESE